MLMSEVFDSTFLKNTSYGLSGAAGGVDLWFCNELYNRKIPYAMYVPFEAQSLTMDLNEQKERELIFTRAANIYSSRNSKMVEDADAGLVVFDGNKGGTHNVFQQLVENNKPFVWVNPVSMKYYEIR
jgi:uncharacterized phage-like protein YoqJ